MSRRSRIQGLAFGAALAALTSAPGLAATPKIVFVDTKAPPAGARVVVVDPKAAAIGGAPVPTSTINVANLNPKAALPSGSPATAADAKVEFVDPMAPSALGHAGMDLSPVGMFESAGGVVQAVIIGLLLASILTWTISLAKWIQLRGEQRRLREAVQKLRQATDFVSIGELDYPPLAEMVVHAEDEMVASSRAGATNAPEGLKDRISLRLDQIEADLRLSAGRGIGVLAIVSSTAPFVGLAGTVWGIMNSFIGIAHSHTTNLAVVAPGIAEALLTTAVGLVAAIPAAVLYNIFARILATYAGAISNAGATVLCLAAREVDSVQGRV